MSLFTFVKDVETFSPVSPQSHQFRSVIGRVHSVLFRSDGPDVPNFRDLPPTAGTIGHKLSHDRFRFPKPYPRSRIVPVRWRSMAFASGPTMASARIGGAG